MNLSTTQKSGTDKILYHQQKSQHSIAFKDLKKFKLQTENGDAGQIHDLYFDDSSWAIKYVVIDSGGWFPGKRLILPVSEIDDAVEALQTIRVNLRREDIENGPGIDEVKPVSRQIVRTLLSHHKVLILLPTDNHYLPNWLIKILKAVSSQTEKMPAPAAGHHQLRSAREIIGYNVIYNDEKIGFLSDLIVNTVDWTIPSIVAKQRKPLMETSVLMLSPEHVETFDWAGHQIELSDPPV